MLVALICTMITSPYVRTAIHTMQCIRMDRVSFGSPINEDVVDTGILPVVFTNGETGSAKSNPVTVTKLLSGTTRLKLESLDLELEILSGPHNPEGCSEAGAAESRTSPAADRWAPSSPHATRTPPVLLSSLCMIPNVGLHSLTPQQRAGITAQCLGPEVTAGR